MPLHIEAHDGTITLPSGDVISPSITQDAFRKTPMFEQAQAKDYGTLPWIHYNFPGGLVDGKQLLTSLCFYDQILVHVTLTADLYPPGAQDWSSYSLDVEAAIKQFHDGLLEQMFGQPTQSQHLSGVDLSASQATLLRPVAWGFPWGSVHSGHDFKGGGTSITIWYGDRHEKASKAYRARQT